MDDDPIGSMKAEVIAAPAGAALIESAARAAIESFRAIEARGAAAS